MAEDKNTRTDLDKEKNNPEEFEKRSQMEVGILDPKEPIERINPFSDDTFERMAKLARGTKAYKTEKKD